MFFSQYFRHKRLEGLQKQYEVLSEKIVRLRAAHPIEVDTSTRFKLELQIQQAEQERDQLELEIQAIEQLAPGSSPVQQSSLLSNKSLRPKIWFAHRLTWICLILLIALGSVSFYSMYHKRRIEPDMRLIRGAVFQIGSEQGDDDEKPLQQVTVPDFYMAQTETTNAQFRHFIEDGGYQNPNYWTPQGNAWRQQQTALEPKYWRDPLHNQPQQPVVGVSWYEAIAYANWLRAKTGKAYRLPSEAEWELACSGSGKRRYPWGNAWNGKFANFADQSYVKVYNHEWADKNFDDGYTYSAPVGSYSPGATPEGIFDLVGNVWEWTASVYRPYPSNLHDGRENLNSDGEWVTRGGGWGSSAEQLRCTNRNRQKPQYAEYNLGFRVVREP